MYFSAVFSSLLIPLLFVFVIAVLGYLVGAINIKGISLGTAGVLLVAILVGVLFSYVPDITVGGEKIVFWGEVASGVKPSEVFSVISDIGTLLFVTAVGLIAGPKFFRSFNKSMVAYIVMGALIILTGVGITVAISAIDSNMSIAMGTGLLSSSLTSTPAFGAAKESAGLGTLAESEVIAGYGIGYLYGVLGVVLFVQIMPKLLKVDIAKERENFVAASTIQIKDDGKKRFALEEFGFFPFFLTIVLGLLIGCVKVPIGNGNYFSFGKSGGTLIAGLIIGHFGHVGKIDLKVSKQTLNLMRELGLVLFLVGAGVPGGVRFVSAFDWIYIVYGIIMATVPMVIGFLVGKFVFKLSIFNNLGAITGGMTSTPALGALISTAGTDDVSSAYAATYPFALVLIVVSCNLLVLLPF